MPKRLPPPRDLAREIERVARNAGLPVERAAYERAGRDPLAPIVCAGNPRAPVCLFGRDLGRAEVRWGQPFVGPAGQRVRAVVLEVFGGGDDADDPLRERALEHVFLANAVPYQPPGNRPYPRSVVELFRPCVERILLECWKGRVVLALGKEAARWFDPYVEAEGAGSRACRLSATVGGRRRVRRIEVIPLPHPSPRNARFSARFPTLLRRALRSVKAARGPVAPAGRRPRRKAGRRTPA